MRRTLTGERMIARRPVAAGCRVMLMIALFALACPWAHAESMLRRAIDADLTALDPHLVGNEYETVITADLFEGLTAYGPDAQIEPGQAERWDVSADGKTYVFHLRPNLRWSDGSPLTSADFVYSIGRALDPATGAPYAEILSPIAGARTMIDGTLRDPSRLGVQSIDPLTLRITLDHPAPYLPAVLAHSMAFAVPRAAIQRWGRDWTQPAHIIGNGPFRLAEWVPQGHLRFTRNPYYHSPSLVTLDQVEWRILPDPMAAYKAFLAQEVDLAPLPTRLAAVARQRLPALLHEHQLMNTRYVEINMGKAPLGTDPRLRTALALTLDQRAIAEKLLRDGSIPAFSFVPDGMQGYRPAHMAFADLPMVDRLAEARRLWAAAGFGRDHPITLTLLTDDLPDYVLEAKAIVALWSQALPGLRVMLDTNEYQIVSQRLVNHDFELSISSWNADFPDPSNFLTAWRADAGTTNVIVYRNAAYDRLLDEAADHLDPAERMARLQAAERLLLDDAAILPYAVATEHTLVAARIGGWQANGLGIHLNRFLSVQNPN